MNPPRIRPGSVALDDAEVALLAAYRRLTSQQKAGVIRLLSAGDPDPTRETRQNLSRLRRLHTCRKAAAPEFQQLVPLANVKRFRCLGCDKIVTISWGD
jgi:hypothetical protein